MKDEYLTAQSSAHAPNLCAFFPRDVGIEGD